MARNIVPALFYLVAAVADPVSAPQPAEGPAFSPKFPIYFTARYHSRDKETTGLYAVGPHDELISFADGSRDHLCGYYQNNYTARTPCTTLITRGWRYLMWPKLESCCRCCSYGEGCGPLSPAWVSNATGNLVYWGKETIDGRVCDKWQSVGLMPDPRFSNYYAQSVETGLPCQVDGYNYMANVSERSEDKYTFYPETIDTKPQDPSLFGLPSYCDAAELCGPTVCDAKEPEAPPSTLGETTANDWEQVGDLGALMLACMMIGAVVVSILHARSRHELPIRQPLISS